jgi:hypothetical protein
MTLAEVPDASKASAGSKKSAPAQGGTKRPKLDEDPWR